MNQLYAVCCCLLAVSSNGAFRSLRQHKLLICGYFSASTTFTSSSCRSFHNQLTNNAPFPQQRARSLPVRIANARLRAHADDIFKAAITSVLPHAMVTKTLKRNGDRLTVGDRHYTLKNNVHVVAFGKAVIGMVRAAEDMLGDHIVDGVASVPWSLQDTMRRLGKWLVKCPIQKAAIFLYCEICRQSLNKQSGISDVLKIAF